MLLLLLIVPQLILPFHVIVEPLLSTLAFPNPQVLLFIRLLIISFEIICVNNGAQFILFQLICEQHLIHVRVQLFQFCAPVIFLNIFIWITLSSIDKQLRVSFKFANVSDCC